MSFLVKCAKVVREVEARKAAFKEAVFAYKADPSFNRIYGVTLQTLSHDALISQIVEAIQGRLSKVNPALLKVLVCEVFLNGKRLKIDHKAVQEIEELRGEIAKKFAKRIEKSKKEAKSLRKVVHFRIHSEKDAVVAKLQESAADLAKDELITDLYSLPYLQYSKLMKGGTRLMNDPNVVIQSKSSCFPVEALRSVIGAKEEGILIEGCSAPGNKTLQIYSAFPRLETYSFEMDRTRFLTLQKRVNFYRKSLDLNPKKQHLVHSDFFCAKRILRNKLDKVRFAVMDPSCSGSGMLNNVHSKGKLVQSDDLQSYANAVYDSLTEEEQSRVASLASFQKKILGFCFTHFRNLEYLVYSTCSVFRQENEDVVAEMLRAFKGLELVPVFPEWPKRGVNFDSDPKLGCLASCIRETPVGGENDGFFTALFRVGRK